MLEEGQGGSVRRVYTYGLNRISQNQPNGTSFYGYDGHASVRQLTDTSGAITDRYDYDAFGNAVGSTGFTPNDFGFAGEQIDLNMGFYYLRMRYYLPQIGRFATTDPYLGSIFDPPSLHRYTFVENNPTNNSDPSGQLTVPEVIVVSAVVGVLSGSITYAVTKSVKKAFAVGTVATLGTALTAYSVAAVLASQGGAELAFFEGLTGLGFKGLQHLSTRNLVDIIGSEREALGRFFNANIQELGRGNYVRLSQFIPPAQPITLQAFRAYAQIAINDIFRTLGDPFGVQFLRLNLILEAIEKGLFK